jgi:hypothetical protein
VISIGFWPAVQSAALRVASIQTTGTVEHQACTRAITPSKLRKQPLMITLSESAACDLCLQLLSSSMRYMQPSCTLHRLACKGVMHSMLTQFSACSRACFPACTFVYIGSSLVTDLQVSLYGCDTSHSTKHMRTSVASTKSSASAIDHAQVSTVSQTMAPMVLICCFVLTDAAAWTQIVNDHDSASSASTARRPDSKAPT